MTPSLRERVEGLVWIIRPSVMLGQMPFVAAAWFVGTPAESAPDYGRLAAYFGVVLGLRNLAVIINDILDAPKDRVTAPFLPIPRGAVTSMAAAELAVASFGIALGVLVWLGVLRLPLLPPVLTLLACGVLTPLYSASKSWGLLSSVISASVHSVPAMGAWWFAGRANLNSFLLLMVVVMLHGMQVNLQAALRDVDGDPKVGNRTWAVRLGPARAFDTATWLAAGKTLLLIPLAFMPGGNPYGLMWIAAALVSTTRAAWVVRPQFASASGRDRLGRDRDLREWTRASFVTLIAISGIYMPLGTLVLGAFLRGWFLVTDRLYRRWIQVFLVREMCGATCVRSMTA